MYILSEHQIDFILNDIKMRGVETEDLQLNLLDHICCIIENEYEAGSDFEEMYQKTIARFFKKELKEIEEETQLLLTYKNYYAMKKTMLVSGTTATIFLLAGSLFKLMHWPGAAILLVLGIVFISLIFLPLLYLTKSRETANRRDKLVMGLGALVGILYCLSTLFKIMHWPGATQLWIATIVLSAFIFIPVYFFTGIQKPDTKINTIVTSILLVGATSILFMLLNIHAPKRELQLKMYNYLQSEELLKGLIAEQNSISKAPEAKTKLLQEINNSCEQIKSLIFEIKIGEKSITNDFEARNIVLEDGKLGREFYSEKRNGAALVTQLKMLLNEYNSSALTQISKDHTVFDDDFGDISNYNVYSVLNSITQLQLIAAVVNK